VQKNSGQKELSQGLHTVFLQVTLPSKRDGTTIPIIPPTNISESDVGRSGRGLWNDLDLMIPLTLSMTYDFFRPEANMFVIKLLKQQYNIEGMMKYCARYENVIVINRITTAGIIR
jgi:hypothetical protein